MRGSRSDHDTIATMPIAIARPGVDDSTLAQTLRASLRLRRRVVSGAERGDRNGSTTSNEICAATGSSRSSS